MSSSIQALQLLLKKARQEFKGTDIVKGGATITLSYEGMESVTYTVVASSDKELKGLFLRSEGNRGTCSLHREKPDNSKGNESKRHCSGYSNSFRIKR